MVLFSMLYGSQDGRWVWGRMDICICLVESLHSSPENITVLLISYTSIWNKKFLKRKKNRIHVPSKKVNLWKRTRGNLLWFPDSLPRCDFFVISAHTSYGVCRMAISGPRLIFSLDHKLLEGSASPTFQSSPVHIRYSAKATGVPPVVCGWRAKPAEKDCATGNSEEGPCGTTPTGSACPLPGLCSTSPLVSPAVRVPGLELGGGEDGWRGCTHSREHSPDTRRHDFASGCLKGHLVAGEEGE